MGKVKKSPEEKLIAQIDRLADKNLGDNALIETLTRQNAAISQSTDVLIRKQFNETSDLIAQISNCVQRRSRLLKIKGRKLAELQTQSLGIAP